MSTEILRPIANGDTIQFTPTGAATNWECVDDIVSDEIVTYVGRGSLLAFNHTDLYRSGPSLGVGIINQIEVFARFSAAYINISPDLSVAINNAGEANIYTGTPATCVTNQWADVIHSWTLNPDTGIRWTWLDIANLQIGFNVEAATDGNYLGVICTQVYITITYGLPISKRVNTTNKILILMGKGVK